jgi:hypothetical protein
MPFNLRTRWNKPRRPHCRTGTDRPTRRAGSAPAVPETHCSAPQEAVSSSGMHLLPVRATATSQPVRSGKKPLLAAVGPWGRSRMESLGDQPDGAAAKRGQTAAAAGKRQVKPIVAARGAACSRKIGPSLAACDRSGLDRKPTAKRPRTRHGIPPQKPW